ncbi:hypothetical protein [Allorhizobium undicola]|uniref:hypothetical protein n=1 Tax=Allorhizobium undicola TaxID=78527 RepID=UPI0012B53920|nr:hypothetical protein [Allorhizobium undicola]
MPDNVEVKAISFRLYWAGVLLFCFAVASFHAGAISARASFSLGDLALSARFARGSLQIQARQDPVEFRRIVSPRNDGNDPGHPDIAPLPAPGRVMVSHAASVGGCFHDFAVFSDKSHPSRLPRAPPCEGDWSGRLAA